jgi:protein TonB
MEAQVQTYVAPAVAVQEEEEESAQPIFTVVEEMPKFPGGETELLRFLVSSIKYPVIAQENGIQGRVTCSFVINRDGSVVDAEVMRGVDPSLDKEALRVVNTMPKWSPGKQRGKPVRVKFTVPVTFRLQ